MSIFDKIKTHPLCSGCHYGTKELRGDNWCYVFKDNHQSLPHEKSGMCYCGKFELKEKHITGADILELYHSENYVKAKQLIKENNYLLSQLLSFYIAMDNPSVKDVLLFVARLENK